MHYVNKIIVFFCILGITLFAYPAIMDGFRSIESKPSDNHLGFAYAADLKADQNNPPKPSPNSRLPLLELLELILGAFLISIGLAILALAIWRWKPDDLSLISFGIFCLLYGTRTNTLRYLFDIPLHIWSYPVYFITYLVPVPIWIFVENILDKGWKSSIRRLWQIHAAFAFVAILVGIYHRDPPIAMFYSTLLSIAGIIVVLANMFRPGLNVTRELKVLRSGGLIFALFALHANITPLFTSGYLSTDLEGLGFLIFIGCLVYIVAHRFFQNEKNLLTIEHELETARQIQSFILPQEMEKIPGIKIAARYVPMNTMAGDFYDFLIIDEKHMGILVADVSGHGVPASLIASMVKIAFVSQRPHASDPSRVLSGINQILCGKLDSDFVTAGYLYIDVEKNAAFYSGGGHPPLLVWQPSAQKVVEYQKKSIILGQIESAQYETMRLGFEAGDRFLLYTDGIVEASNRTGNLFGSEQFKAFITSNYRLPGNQFADKLIEAVSNWSGKGFKDTLDDDLTLIVIDCEIPGNVTV